MVISIKPVYIPLLYILYPQYNPVKEIQQPDSFILIRDVTSREDFYKISKYPDCLVISKTLFGEQWDEKELCKQALEFRRVNFKSRKKSLPEIESLRDDDFTEALTNFIMTGILPLQEEDIMPVLTSIGSSSFAQVYLTSIQNYPEAKLRAAIMTFLSKIAVGTSESLFYKRKTIQLGSRLKSNLTKSISAYNNSDKSSLAFVEFIMSVAS